MMSGSKPLSLKTVLMSTAGGAAILLVGAQLLAKPAELSTKSSTAGSRTAESRTERAQTPSPAPLAFAGQPRIRELFVPLVGRPVKKAPAGGPLASAPTLPPVTTTTPAVTTPKPAPTASATPTTAAPAPTGSSDLQMLGVVQLDDVAKVLLKRTSTGESRYLAKGENAFGFKVEEIREGDVSLSRDGKTEKVAMSTAVTIEGPGSTSIAAASTFRSSDYGRGDRGDRGSRGDRGDRGDRGSRGVRGDQSASGGTSGGGYTDAQLLSLPTWPERLKKLEEIKATMDPARYERWKKFFTSKIEAETKK